MEQRTALSPKVGQYCTELDKQVSQESTMGTKVNILEIEARLVQRKCLCMKALKGEVVMPISLAQSKKTEMADTTRNIVIWYLRGKPLREEFTNVATVMCFLKIQGQPEEALVITLRDHLREVEVGILIFSLRCGGYKVKGLVDVRV